MPVTSVSKDPHALTMTVMAEFPVSRERLWEAYADPRQLEKFWGPVDWPATFTRHDMYPGGRSHFFMTGPDGEHSAGVWEFLAVDPGHSFEVRDAFADEAGNENLDMPSMRMTFQFEAQGDGSRLITTTTFGSVEQLEQLLGMGMEEGMTSAMSQIDAVVADHQSFAAGHAAELVLMSDAKVRVTRVIRGSMEQVWAAHTQADLVKRWMFGPGGWTMTVCEVGAEVRDPVRYEWEPDGGGEGGFGFEGEVLESRAPHRLVTTEALIGEGGEPSINEMTLTSVGDGTLLTWVITYPNAESCREAVDTGMAKGMETSYARLEREVLA